MEPLVLFCLLFDGLVFLLTESFTEQNVIGLDSNNVTAATVTGTSFRAKLHLWLRPPYLSVCLILWENIAALHVYCHQFTELLVFLMNMQLCTDAIDCFSRFSSEYLRVMGRLFVSVSSWHRASTALRALCGATTQTASSSRSTPETRLLHWARWRRHCSPLKVSNAFTHTLHPLQCKPIIY